MTVPPPGRTWLAQSIGLAAASANSILGWTAKRKRTVLLVDGEMLGSTIQERLRAISNGMACNIPNDGFRVLAADQTEHGINLSTEEGQKALMPHTKGVDLLILDSVSRLLSLRRQKTAMLMVHHAGTSGRQRGTSRREDVLDTVIALRRPEDYLPEQGARFEVHYEKLRHHFEGAQAFEARLEDDGNAVRWRQSTVTSLPQVGADLFNEGYTVQAAANALGISRSAAGRLRQRAAAEGLLFHP